MRKPTPAMVAAARDLYDAAREALKAFDGGHCPDCFAFTDDDEEHDETCAATVLKAALKKARKRGDT